MVSSDAETRTGEGARLGEESFRRLVLDERVRMVRAGNGLRVCGGLLFFLLFIGQEILWRDGGRYDAGSREAVVWLFGGYVIAAILVWWAGRRSDRWATWTFLAIPCLDMVMVLARQWLTLGTYGLEELQDMTGFGTMIYVVLVVLALMSMSRRFLLVCGLAAAGLQLLWKARIGSTLSDHLWSIVVIGTVTALLMVVMSRLVALVRRAVDERERRVRLNRFFSPQVVEVLEERAGGELRSEAREVTVLFSDLRGFTERSRRMSDADAVGLLNRHHTAMAEVVFANGGTLDKFLGDGMLVYFGAPASQPDHAERAIRCALAMQERLEEENRSMEGAALVMGVGVHTGMVITGEIGPPNRREYTAIGDTVNVASRIEGLTKVHGVGVLVSAATREALGRGGGGIVLRAMPPAEVRGVAEPVLTWAVG